MPRAGLERSAKQGRLQVPVAQHGGGLAQQRAVDRGEAGPARGRVDPLVKLAIAAVGHGQHRDLLAGGEAGVLRGRRDGAVGDEQDPVEAVDQPRPLPRRCARSGR